MADRGVNLVVLLGRLAVDPDVRAGKNGKYCYLKIAVNTEQPFREEQKTEYIRAVWFRPANTLPYLLKGRQVHITGRLEGFAKEGESIQMTVNVDRLILTDNKPGKTEQNGNNEDEREEYIRQLEERITQLSSVPAAPAPPAPAPPAPAPPAPAPPAPAIARTPQKSSAAAHKRSTAKRPTAGKGKGR